MSLENKNLLRPSICPKNTVHITRIRNKGAKKKEREKTKGKPLIMYTTVKGKVLRLLKEGINNQLNIATRTVVGYNITVVLRQKSTRVTHFIFNFFFGKSFSKLWITSKAFMTNELI